MTQWITEKINQKRLTSVLSQLDNAHKDMVRKDRDYLKVIIESVILSPAKFICTEISRNQNQSSGII